MAVLAVLAALAALAALEALAEVAALADVAVLAALDNPPSKQVKLVGAECYLKCTKNSKFTD